MIEFTFYAKLNLTNSCEPSSLLKEGENFSFTGRINYYRFDEKSPSILQLEVKYTAYNVIKHWFKEDEKIPKEIIRWVNVDNFKIYEEIIMECKKVKASE